MDQPIFIEADVQFAVAEYDGSSHAVPQSCVIREGANADRG
jgi:hypothetical protein